MIKRKIKEIAEEICGHCAQNYQDECRAFQWPHSDQERTAREQGDALCVTSSDASAKSGPPELREEESKEEDLCPKPH